MSIFAEKGYDKYEFRKYKYGKVIWAIDWPKADGREDWKRNIGIIAVRCGHKVKIDIDRAIITEKSGRQVILQTCNHAGDWRAIFFDYVDAVHTGRVEAPAPSVVFPPVASRPVNPVLRDGFTPSELNDYKNDVYEDMLRVLRPVTYSELVSIDGTCTLVQGTKAFKGHKTGLSLMECACGRIFIAHDSIIDPGPKKWRSCVCHKTLMNCGYTGERVDTIRGAWREWCTMKLLSKSPTAALHKLLAEEGVTMECNLPDKFEEFWRWYSYYAKKAKQLYVQRIDKAKPFSIDNLTFDVPRELIKDPANGKRFKVDI